MHDLHSRNGNQLGRPALVSGWDRPKKRSRSLFISIFGQKFISSLVILVKTSPFVVFFLVESFPESTVIIKYFYC